MPTATSKVVESSTLAFKKAHDTIAIGLKAGLPRKVWLEPLTGTSKELQKQERLHTVQWVTLDITGVRLWSSGFSLVSLKLQWFGCSWTTSNWNYSKAVIHPVCHCLTCSQASKELGDFSLVSDNETIMSLFSARWSPIKEIAASYDISIIWELSMTGWIYCARFKGHVDSYGWSGKCNSTFRDPWNSSNAHGYPGSSFGKDWESGWIEI